MAKIKQKINITDEEARSIRRKWDKERQRQYYSVTDVMSVLTDSVDARNYWKALKSRLKTNHLQLVMDCNQLKMEASDGKSYMVDVADADTLVKIIQIVAPCNASVFRSWFDHIDVQNSINSDPSLPQNNSSVISDGNITEIDNQESDELSTTLLPAIDIFENKNEIIIQVMLAGVDPSKIIIAVNMKTLTIKGERKEPQNISSENYFYKELQWGQFYREIKLQSQIDIDQIVATEFRGLITIRLPKIDLDKNRFIKIKSIDK
jgi:HSP20 family molecular chaperone IbpA